MTDLPTTLTFIASSATESDITRIYDACKARTKTLRAIRAASIVEGAEVELTGLSPKYLNGLAGTVTKISGDRGDVTLDEESTSVLQFTRQSRFHVAVGQTSFVIPGVPLSCCKQS